MVSNKVPLVSTIDGTRKVIGLAEVSDDSNTKEVNIESVGEDVVSFTVENPPMLPDDPRF